MVGLKLSIEEKLREFLKEDIGFGDITSEALIGDDQMADARIFYRENGIAAGLEEVATLFQILGCNVKTLVRDGNEVKFKTHDFETGFGLSEKHLESIMQYLALVGEPPTLLIENKPT